MQFGYEQYPTQQVAPQAQPQAQPQMLQTKILVLNATGKHGIGACRGLRDAGYTAVFGSSRSKESKTLSALGVTTVQGNYTDVVDLAKMFEQTGATHAIGITDYFGAGKGKAALEITHGKAIVDACKAANVQHLVFTSVLGYGECPQ
ncbi:hypothetical protein T484DRAFT_1835856 [Baffinella frigidus]|nr:hypothetical protein T484DRAFT_1835856 [Cryptophyta sp. CCMP2293]